MVYANIILVVFSNKNDENSDNLRLKKKKKLMPDEFKKELFWSKNINYNFSDLLKLWLMVGSNIICTQLHNVF